MAEIWALLGRKSVGPCMLLGEAAPSAARGIVYFLIESGILTELRPVRAADLRIWWRRQHPGIAELNYCANAGEEKSGRDFISQRSDGGARPDWTEHLPDGEVNSRRTPFWHCSRSIPSFGGIWWR